jgi:hypothetical protein
LKTKEKEMKKENPMNLGLILVSVMIAAIGLGCGQNRGNDGGGRGSVRGITLEGSLDPAVFNFQAASNGPASTIGSAPGPAARPESLTAAVMDIDAIIAISSRGTYPATINPPRFSVFLPAGTIYLIGFYHGPDLVARLKFDASSDLDSIPVLYTSTDVDLGTVSYNAVTGLASGSISQPELFADLDLNAELAKSVGIMDNELLVQSNLDVDKNGTVDGDEGKQFTFWIVSGGLGAEKLSELHNWSNKDLLTCPGYAYYFKMEPPDTTLPWSTSILISPDNINGGNNQPADLVFGETSTAARGLVFYGLTMATTPMPPPAGTYTVRIGGQDFIFANVSSSPMDINLNNVFVPEVYLILDGEGKATFIEWKFWYKSAGAWRPATDTELQLLIDKLSIGTVGMGASGLESVVINPIPTASGAAVFPDQTVAPAFFQFEYLTASKYVYSFRWSK